MKKGDVQTNNRFLSPLGATKIKRTFFTILLIIISLVLIELFSYSYIKLTSDKGTYVERVKPVDSPYHPYLGYVHAPNFTFTITKGAVSRAMAIKTDENGFSITPYFSHQDPVIRIIVTGGSTIFGVGSSDNSTTVPSILEKIINQQMNCRTEVVNVALRGANSFQEMLLVARYLAEYKADLVLSISGVNDAAHDPSTVTVEDRFLRRHIWNNAVSLVHRAEHGDLMVINLVHKLRSWSYGFDLLYRQLKKDARPAQGDLLATGMDLDLRRETLIDIPQQARITAFQFAAADQISRMNKAGYIMILQPTLFTKKNWSAEETYLIKERKWSDQDLKTSQMSQHQFYDALRKTEKPFEFIDLSGIFSESRETLYIDHCHYNDLAAERFATEIFKSIQPTLQEIVNRKQSDS